MANASSFLVQTRAKTIQEVDAFYAWIDENFIDYIYAGDSAYWITGEGDATLVKLVWG